MIRDTINKLSENIKALTWVDVFGGMTFKVRVPIVDKGSNKVVNHATYPVSCDANSDSCFNKEVYSALTPDASKRSVVYWSELSPVTLSPSSIPELRSRDSAVLIKQNLLLTAWINLSNTGIKCFDNLVPALELINALSKGATATEGLLSFKLTPIKINTDPTKIFSDYSYSKDLKLVLSPYTAVSVEFLATAEIATDCLDPWFLNTFIC